MTKKRKIYTSEFKTQAIALVKEANRSAACVARELGININTLHNWLSLSAKLSKSPVSKESAEEIKRLKKELAQSNMERDILKKAAAYFAKETL
jgi:transposase